MPAVGSTVSARPRTNARLWTALAVAVLALFVVIAAVMKKANAGAHFGPEDQIFTVVLGLILASFCLLPTRPRLLADHDGARVRGYVGAWRAVPWDVVERVEFPANSRFPRLVLPGEELITLYAVRRSDRETAISVMKGLRDLHAASRAD